MENKQVILQTSRNYCFTAFNLDQLNKLKSLKEIKYICYENEICPKTGTFHYQGYLELTKPMRFAALIKQITNETCFIRFFKRKGTQQQAIDYCKKDAIAGKEGCVFEEYGERAQQGERTDLNIIYDALDNGENFKELWKEHQDIFTKHHKAFEKYASLVEPTRNWQTELEIHYGKAGTGKSKKAHEENPDAYDLLIPNSETIWFDGYNNHEVVIIDDFYGNMPISMLLKLADRYGYKVPIKGGSVNFCPKKIIITSNLHPALWYKNINVELKEAFARRITKLVSYDNNFDSQNNRNEEQGNSDTCSNYNKLKNTLKIYQESIHDEYIDAFNKTCIINRKKISVKISIIINKEIVDKEIKKIE